MRYEISATVGEEDQTPYKCDEKPLVPSIGDNVLLVTQNGPRMGKVIERTFVYRDDACHITLKCDDIYAQ